MSFASVIGPYLIVLIQVLLTFGHNQCGMILKTSPYFFFTFDYYSSSLSIETCIRKTVVGIYIMTVINDNFDGTRYKHIKGIMIFSLVVSNRNGCADLSL